MNQLMQMLNMIQSSTNPQAMLQNMAGNNPLLQRAMSMAQGKNTDQLRVIAENLCRQRGMNPQQMQMFFGQFGL